jgi:hypothetical protein
VKNPEPVGDIEDSEEPAPSRLSFSMRRKMALVGLAYFSIAIVLLAATHPEETGAARPSFNYTGDVVYIFENFHALGTGEYFVQLIPAYKAETHSQHWEGLSLGYLYLNASEDWSREEACWIVMYTGYDYKPPVGLQTRLKCSDNNGLQGDGGGGHRSWGFGETGPPQGLEIRWPEYR